MDFSQELSVTKTLQVTQYPAPVKSWNCPSFPWVVPNAFAAALDLHPSQLAIAWVRHSPGVAASIVGASSATQLASTLRAFDVELTEDQYQTVTDLFDTEVKEEAGGKFPSLRRLIGLTS